MSRALYIDPALPKEPISSNSTVVYQIDPLQDPRWNEFLQRHSRSSAFHSTAWLTALSQTYGYRPVAFTTSPAFEQLDNGMIFCQVESWLTGRRLVSLPFSDHCEPLVDTQEERQIFAAALEKEVGRWRYLELRPLQSFDITTSMCNHRVNYSFHQLDLRPDLDEIYERFHKNSTQRKIRRAEREGLRYEAGSTEILLDSFYRLFKMTRRRHNLPPQPREWFRNLMGCFGDALKIRITFKDERPVAGMLTLSYKDTLVYKYGCSDTRFNNLGGTHMLFWRSIQEGKMSGLKFFDFGRTDPGQTGLLTFKNRWGATQSMLTYSRYTISGKPTHLFDLTTSKWKTVAAKKVIAHLRPRAILMLGRALYKHVG